MKFIGKLIGIGILCTQPCMQIGAEEIRGLVKDSKGEPLPGVSIQVKGSTIGTISDENGRFFLDTPKADGSLIFSFLGYEKIERRFKDKLEVILKEDVKVLGEVLVTTQKRAQTSIEVPTAVSAMSGKSLAQLALNQLDEVSNYIPGLQVQIQSPNNPGYVIRGVTSDDGASYAQPRISVFQDGISTSRSRASVAEVFDMERVEVVKGPQGTLFGRGAEIGAIHMIRNKPVDYLTAEITANYGSYNQRGLNGFINTPIVKDKLANRFAFSYDAHDGYINNLSGGKLNGKSSYALRNSTRLFIGEKTTLKLILDYQYDNYPGTSFKSKTLAPVGGDTSPFTAASLERGDYLGIKRHVGGATFLADYNLNQKLSLSSITGFRAFKSDENFDADGTYLPLLDCEEHEKGTQFSQEFRMNYDNKKNFTGFIGASYFYENSSQNVVTRTNMQYLFPAYAYQGFSSKVKPQFEAMAGQLGSLFPEAYKPMIDQMINGLMDKWFPNSYELGASMTSTPDFYGDIKKAISAYGMDLDAMLGSMGTQGATILQTLKASSSLPLNTAHEENGTNYGINQAAEIFADGTLNIYKGLSLTAGVRGSFEHQKTGYFSTTVPDPVFGSILYTPSDGKKYYSKSYTSWVGRIALNYMFGRNNAYISASRGRRPGVVAFNNDPEDLTELKPEIIWSYEAGLKGVILNGRLNYDLSAYYYDWNHFQTQRLEDKEGTVGKLYVADDAGKAHSFGVEVGLNYMMTNWLNVFGNYSFIDGKFNDKDENGIEQEYAGNRFRLTPKHSYSFGMDFHSPIAKNTILYIRPSYSYKSKVYFEDDNDENLTQSGYGLLNLNIGVRIQSKGATYYEISGFGKNLCDKEYLIDAGNSGRQIGYATYVAGSPRVLGIQFKIGF